MDGATKGLAFSNLLNGVPDWQVARDMRLTGEEVKEAFEFVRDKVKSYCFERRMPPTPCETVEEAKRNRMVLLNLLRKLNLDKPPTVKGITRPQAVVWDDAMGAFTLRK